MCSCILEVTCCTPRSICTPPVQPLTPSAQVDRAENRQRWDKRGANPLHAAVGAHQCRTVVFSPASVACWKRDCHLQLLVWEHRLMSCALRSAWDALFGGAWGSHSLERAAWEVGPSAVVSAVSQRRHRPIASEPQERVSSPRAGCHIPSSMSNTHHPFGL